MKKYTLKDLLLPERQRQATGYFVKNLSRRPPADRSVIRRPRSPEEVQLLSEVIKRDFERLQKEKALEIDGRVWKFQIYTQYFDQYLNSLKILSHISNLFQKCNTQPILVGGSAVELYTFGHYKTLDVDIVITDSQEAEEILSKLTFEKISATSNFWYNRKLNIPIRLHSSPLAGSLERTNEIINDHFSIRVIGLEDLILDRLRTGICYNAPRYTEFALHIIHTFWDKVDFAYLEEKNDKRTNFTCIRHHFKFEK